MKNMKTRQQTGISSHVMDTIQLQKCQQFLPDNPLLSPASRSLAWYTYALSWYLFLTGVNKEVIGVIKSLSLFISSNFYFYVFWLAEKWHRFRIQVVYSRFQNFGDPFCWSACQQEFCTKYLKVNFCSIICCSKFVCHIRCSSTK